MPIAICAAHEPHACIRRSLRSRAHPLMSRTPAHAHTQMQMLYALHVERINTGINQAGGLDPVAESTRQMPTLAHALMLSNAHKRAHAHTQTGRGMDQPSWGTGPPEISQANVDTFGSGFRVTFGGFRVTFGKIVLRLGDGEVVHELHRVAEITELRHSVAVRQLGRRARRHLRHTHTHTLCALSVRRPHRRSATRSAAPGQIPSPTF